MSEDLSGFTGQTSLFPLPNLVLFPHVLQPLHIFEPRYRQMTADALAGDHLLALTLLRSGWEADYAGCPAVHVVACLGRIVADQRLADGRFHILVRGMSRVRIDHEIPQSKLYRRARVELLADACLPDAPLHRKLRRRLVKCVPAWFPAKGAILAQFRKLLRSDLTLGALCDIVSFALPLEVAFKQQLLEEVSVIERVRMLLAHLEEHEPEPDVPSERKFPPEFSTN
jgi:Lon protease-like protein